VTARVAPLGIALLFTSLAAGDALEIAGLTLTPHVMADSMRYRRDAEPAVGARVQLFIQNPAGAATLALAPAARMLLAGKSPADLLAAQTWAWHDFPSAAASESATLPPGAMTVWTFNGRAQPFGPTGRVRIEAGPQENPWLDRNLDLDAPTNWISAVTFFASDGSIHPDTMVVHIANESKDAMEIQSCRLWLPPDPKSPRVLFAQPSLTDIAAFNGHSVIPARDRGGFVARMGPLPLSYSVVEVQLTRKRDQPLTLWAHLRIKPEQFDISGGWVNDKNVVTQEVFLKTLARLHVNTAHLALTPGYSDTDLYARYPLKYFGELTPVETYDTDERLPRIHAVEFLGEPQYGGGRPVPPQEVWEKLHPYAPTRLATTLTHSEERIWRDYAGLSDFPHYDAYRVSAPSPDAWPKYDRWHGQRLGWGAPLETIGDMCRSLRELNRPMPCAIWSQGPHHGWDVYAGRQRTSPTPDEMRLQAYHAVSTRITSLYWFNLSIDSLVKWRDTLGELTRIGRELRMLDEFILEGDAYHFERNTKRNGDLDWDLASVCGPRAAMLFALDLDYTPEPDEKIFRFAPPREARWRFRIPKYLSGVQDVFRVDADGTAPARWTRRDSDIVIEETANRVAIYIATPDPALRAYIDSKRANLIATEEALQFDPATNDDDFREIEVLTDE